MRINIHIFDAWFLVFMFSLQLAWLKFYQNIVQKEKVESTLYSDKNKQQEDNGLIHQSMHSAKIIL